MLDGIYIVVGSRISDIGKGWLTASIASILPNSVPLKIDPMLNEEFPSDVGIKIQGKYLSDDFITYKKLNLPIYPECNIMLGKLLRDFIEAPVTKSVHDSIKKMTFSDVGNFLARRILDAIKPHDFQNLVIEIGGTVADPEHTFVSCGLNSLRLMTGITPNVVLLGYLDAPEITTGSPVKSTFKHDIRETRRRYSLPIKACFVRRRLIPRSISDEKIKLALLKIASETQLPSTRIIFEPNFDSVQELRDFVKSEYVFKTIERRYAISACLMGVPCRYDGSHENPDGTILSLLNKHGVIAICPELIAGLSLPRGPYEIIGGDGHAVLNGKARVVSDSNEDVTDAFIKGAKEALNILNCSNITDVILFDKSPSCGNCNIFDGTFKKTLIPGVGVFTAMLEREGSFRIRGLKN